MSDDVDTTRQDTPSQEFDSGDYAPDEDDGRPWRSVDGPIDHEGFRNFCEARKPMEQLPLSLTVNHELLKDPCYTGPIKVSFGLGVSSDALVEYAIKHKGIERRAVEEGRKKSIGTIRALGVYKAVRFLKYISGAPYLSFCMPISMDVDYVVELYNNYTKEELEMDEQDEREVLEILKKELGISQEETPKWWFFSD
ncbi:hypothetical protein DENSPDRAFT_926611 [Dentipellis sp. KUC8613]|nr:hypothetical protein DENSPDRAFT_926611 [Dentipellis sp. KUC8613]